MLHALLATPEFYVDSPLGTAMLVVGGLGLMSSMLILGVLAWSAPPPKWTAVVMVVGGLLSFMPDVAYVGLAIFAAANLVMLRRSATKGAVETLATPP